MKKSLLLALTFVAACGYVMAQDAATPAAPKDETAQTAAPATPATEDEKTQTEAAPQEDESLDMDAMLDETEEAK